MSKDVFVVIGFILIIMLICKLWNIIMMKQYEKESNTEINNIIKYGTYIEGFAKLELAGTGNDGNSDFEFKQAVKKIDVPDDVRIKVYD